jgi:glutamate-1-semialdehyde aminotransferase
MRGGLAQLHELERIDGWKLLEELGMRFETVVRDGPTKAKADITFHRIGLDVCFGFAPGPVLDLASAQRSNLKCSRNFSARA